MSAVFARSWGWDKSFFGGVGRMWRDGGGIVAVSRFYGCKMGLIY